MSKISPLEVAKVIHNGEEIEFTVLKTIPLTREFNDMSTYITMKHLKKLGYEARQFGTHPILVKK